MVIAPSELNTTNLPRPTIACQKQELASDQCTQHLLHECDRRDPKAGETQCGAWDPPVPFEDNEVPPFPTSTLPAWLRVFVEAEATATQTPPDMVAMLTLPTIAAAIAKKVEVVVKEGYSEPVNIFTVTAMPPGSRKSEVFRDVVAPLKDFEQSESRRLKPDIAEAISSREVKQNRRATEEGRA